MSNEENIENVDAQEETQETTTTEETVETPMEGETMDWKAEALKYKAMLIRQKKKSPQLLEKVPTELFKDVQDLKLERVKREFGFANGLSPEETDFIFRFDAKNPEDAYKHPLIKSGIETLRAEKKANAGTLSPSSRSTKIFSDDFSKLSTEDRQKQFESRMKSIKR